MLLVQNHIDILFITERYVDCNITDNAIQIGGYTIRRLDKGYGWIFYYIKDGIHCL